MRARRRQGIAVPNTLRSRVGAKSLVLFALASVSLSLPATAFVNTPAGEALPERRVQASSGASLLQASEQSRAAARRLEAATGGAWQLQWNERRGIASAGRGGPRPASARLAAAGILAAADLFQSRHATLLGAAGATLERTRLRHAGKAWHVTWQQRQGERRVVGAVLDLTLAGDGTVVAFRSSLVPGLATTPVHLDAAVALAAAVAAIGRPLELENAEPVLVPVEAEAGTTAVPALELYVGLPSGARWRALVEAGSQRLLALDSLVWESVLSGTAKSLVQPHTPFDEPVDVVLPWLEVRLGFGENDPSTHTDSQGDFAFDADPGEVMLRSGLRGLYLVVDNEAPTGPPSYQRLVPVPGQVELRLGGAEARMDERTIYYHSNLMHDWLRQQFDFRLLDFPMPAVAAAVDPYTGDPNYPNAYWNGTRLGFGPGGATYWNLGLFADVIYHEYTHAATDYIYRPSGALLGPMGTAMHEALADYFAATVTDDPQLGELLYRHTTGPVRNLLHRRIWPEHRDRNNEPHANGEIFGGALWDTRQQTGATVADALVHYARELFPRSFEEFREAMLLQDDLLFDDGWAGNGSPHREAVLTAFGAHGMGPLGPHTLTMTHTPLKDSESGAPRPVVAQIRSFVVDDDGYVRLSYRIGSEGNFVHQEMQRTAEGSYSATIPGMPQGTLVQYYIAAVRFDPIYPAYQPATAPEAVFSYRVGADTEPPQLEHAPLVAVPSFGWPAELGVRLQDNLGVAYAYAEIWRAGHALGSVGLVAAGGDPDLYLGRFPNVGGAVGERFEYVLTAVDASRAGNSTRFPAQGRLEFVVVQDLLDDFERGAGSWRHRAVVLARPDPWQLTAAFNHGQGPGHAWLCGVENGEVPAMTAAELLSDWFQLGNGGHASIWSWMEAELAADGSTARDGGRIEIQGEGASAWSVLLPEGGYPHALAADDNTNPLGPAAACLSGSDGAWQQLHFDLAPWDGQRVRLRFLFGSDARVAAAPRRGWLLDDFAVVPGATNPTESVELLPTRLELQVGPNPFHPQPHLPGAGASPAGAPATRSPGCPGTPAAPAPGRAAAGGRAPGTLGRQGHRWPRGRRGGLLLSNALGRRPGNWQGRPGTLTPIRAGRAPRPPAAGASHRHPGRPSLPGTSHFLGARRGCLLAMLLFLVGCVDRFATDIPVAFHDLLQEKYVGKHAWTRLTLQHEKKNVKIEQDQEVLITEIGLHRAGSVSVETLDGKTRVVYPFNLSRPLVLEHVERALLDALWLESPETRYAANKEKYGARIADAVRDHKILPDMPIVVAYLSWGAPTKVVPTKRGQDERWEYNTPNLKKALIEFRGGKVAKSDGENIADTEAATKRKRLRRTS